MYIPYTIYTIIFDISLQINKTQIAASKEKERRQSASSIDTADEEDEFYFEELKKLPGGQLATKGSVFAEDIPKHIGRRIRTALNVVYFKFPLKEYGTWEELLEVLLQLREQVPFMTKETLVKVSRSRHDEHIHSILADSNHILYRPSKAQDRRCDILCE